MTSLTPGRCSNASAGTGPGEAQLDLVVGQVAQARRPVSTWTSRPSRMIATRSQVFSTSDRMWLDRKTVWPSADGLAQHGEERLLDERVEAGGRLVEDEQLGLVLEGDDQADLLLVALASTRGSGGVGSRSKRSISDSW